MAQYTAKELEQVYQDSTALVTASCTLLTELVGGQPAGEDGIRQFVKHHLEITDEAECEKAVQRILREEVGERDTTPAEGEIVERETYGVNVIRHDEFGPYLGDWMVKACIKAAFSRMGMFVEKRGSKGNVAELGRVRAFGPSAVHHRLHPERIYLTLGEELAPAPTTFKEFSGRVNTPQGAKSIKHHSECAAPGTRFGFEFRFLPGTAGIKAITEKDVVKMLSFATVIGLGSAKALERGKFIVDACSIEIPKKVKDEPATGDQQ